MEPGVKVNRTYYRDNFLAKKLLSNIFRISQGGVLSFKRTVHWRIEYATPSLSWSERCQTSFLQHCGRRIQRIWTQSIIAYGVYCRRKFTDRPTTIANVSELDMRLMGRFVQSIVDAAIGQWRCRLSACVRGAGHTLSTKHEVSTKSY